MIELVQAIPDVDMLLALAPEELASKILFLLRKRGGGNFHPVNLEGELWNSTIQQRYPNHRRSEVSLALAEAWAWLSAQGLVVPDAGSNGQNGWLRLSRRACRMETEADFTGFKIARLLPRDILHPRIADSVWRAFMRGEYDVAVFQAMKTVEVSVREAAKLPDGLIGVKLMREAFSEVKGPLIDMNAEPGERVGRMDLFAGAIAGYKNPHSHRDVNLNDPAEAIEIILLANHLLRIVDARVQVRKDGICP